MAYQDDKYENFLANLNVGRASLVKFATFTFQAVGAAGVPPLIAGHGAALGTALTSFEAELVERIGAGGVSQTGTGTEDEAFAAFKKFIQTTDVAVLQPHFLRNPTAEPTFYPDKLSGLTQALKRERLGRLTAYTEALESANADLLALPVPVGAPAGTVGQRPGAAARALLTAYTAAATAKTKSRTALKDAIVDLSPVGVALVEALWDVHTAALYTHRRAPKEARKYFDYAGLPYRKTKANRKTT